MKILISESTDGETYCKFDFGEPLVLDATELKKFISLLRSIFHPEIVEIEEFCLRDKRLGDKLFLTPWSVKEISLLIKSSDNNEKLKGMIGRSWMSVEIMRGKKLMEFDEFFHNKGFDPKLRYDTRRLPDFVKQFLEEERRKIEEKRLLKKESKLEQKYPYLYNHIKKKIIELKEDNELRTRQDFNDMKEDLSTFGYHVSIPDIRKFLSVNEISKKISKSKEKS